MRTIRDNPLYAGAFQKIHMGRWEDAEQLFEQQRAKSSKPAEISGIEYYLGKVKTFKGDLKGAEERFLRSMKILKDNEDLKKLLVYPLCELAFINLKQGDKEKAHRFLVDAEKIIEESKQSSGLFYHYRGIYHYHMNRVSESFSDLKKALKIFNEENARENSAFIYDSLGQFHFEKGELEDAIFNFEESIQIKKETGDLFGLALTWGNLGRAYFLKSEYEKAFSYFNKDYQFCWETGDRYGQMIMLNNLGRTYLQMGHIEEGTDLFRRSIEMAEALDNHSWILLNTKDLAKASIEGGHIERCRAQLDEIMPEVEKLGNLRLKAELLSIEALYYQKLEMMDDSERICREALKLLSSIDVPYELITMKMQLGKLLFEKGEKARALEIFESALLHAEEMRAPWMINKFEELIKNVGEKDWIKIRLRRYLGKDVMDEVLTGVEKFTLGGKRQKVTVLISDLRGYTKYSEDKSPEEIVTMLNDYFSVMIEVILRYKGTIDKFIGDAILVYFGAPITYGNDSERALKTAEGMMKALQKYNKLRAHKKDEPLEMGIGIDTGEVIVGNIGSYRRRDYTVVGKIVTRAFQLCSDAPGGTIFIGENTFEENQGGPLRERIKPIVAEGERMFQFLWNEENLE